MTISTVKCEKLPIVCVKAVYYITPSNKFCPQNLMKYLNFNSDFKRKKDKETVTE